MKTCVKCGKRRKITNFNVNVRAADGKSSWCKFCANTYGKEDYQRNKDRYFAHAKKRDAKMRTTLDNLKNKPCADCGVLYPPWVTDFHHIDPTTKIAAICQLMRKRVALQTLLDEVAKCVLICANCHRQRHHVA